MEHDSLVLDKFDLQASARVLKVDQLLCFALVIHMYQLFNDVAFEYVRLSHPLFLLNLFNQIVLLLHSPVCFLIISLIFEI